MYRILVFDWNPNGTNDIAICKGSKIVEFVEEATFGIDVAKLNPFNFNQSGQYAAYIRVQDVLRRIAVSPVSDGMDTVKTLKKYFKGVA